jgi:hypothetical protein
MLHEGFSLLVLLVSFYVRSKIFYTSVRVSAARCARFDVVVMDHAAIARY